MDKAVFLPKVIQYDRYQPEFYEDTKTYISKRVNKIKIDKALSLYQEKNLHGYIFYTGVFQENRKFLSKL